MNTYTVRYNEDTRTIELIQGGQSYSIDPDNKSDMKWYKRVTDLPNTVYERVDAAGVISPSDKDHAPLINTLVRFNQDTKEIFVDNGIESFVVDQNDEDDIELYDSIMAEDTTTYEVVDAAGVVTPGDKATAPIITSVVRYNEDTDTIEIDNGIQTRVIDPDDKDDMKFYKKVMKKDSTTFERIDAAGNVVSRNKEDAPFTSVRVDRNGRSRVRVARRTARTRNSGGHSKALKVGAIVAGSAAGLAALTAGGCALIKNHKAKVATNNTNTNTNTSIDDLDITDENFNEIINERFANNESARVFYTALRDSLVSMNYAAAGPNFVVEKDKETLSVLRFNHNEIMAAMIALNNYSAQELQDIFGDYPLSKEEVFENYKSFINKMSIYYMNAKEPLGISSLIRDEANRTLFEQFESAIITFNGDLSNKNADNIIRLFEYYIVQSSTDYVYTADINEINNMSSAEFDAYVKKMNADGKDSTDRLELDTVTAPFVKHLIINMVQSYRNANSQADYKTYRTVSSTAGNFDKLFTTDPLAQVQKGQVLDEYFTRADEESLSIIETVGCETSKVEKHINTSVDALSELQSKTRTEIAALLADAGLSDLADKVLDGISKEEYQELRANDKASEILDSKLGSSELESLLLTVTFSKFDDETFELKHGYMDESGKGILRGDDAALATLFNNRVRGLEKIKGATSYDSTQKENSTSTTVVTQTTESEVDYSDLNDEEKASVKDQEEEIKDNTYQVIIDDKTFDQGDASKAAKAGWEDGTSYANNGSYSYHDVINNVNPDAPSVVPTNGSLFNTAANAYAFEGVVISTSDSQIQSRLSSDLAKYVSSNSGDYSDSYKEGWLLGVQQVLDAAVREGALLRSEAEEEYRKAKDAVDKLNNGQDEEKEDDQTVGTTEKEDDFDGLDLYDPDDEILNPPILDSVDGIDDVYDPEFDGTDNSYIAFTEEPTFDDEYVAYTEEQTTEDVKVLVKTTRN